MPTASYGRPEAGESPRRLAYRKPEAAALLGISLRTLERLAARGVLKPDVRLGRLSLWSHDTLTRWLERGGRP